MNEPGTLPRDPWSTAEIRAALRDRYAPPRYAYIEEVGNSTGFEWSRSCDAIAISCWKSAGALEVNGFEVKCSRADWLRELKDPNKAETFRVFCDRWWLVIGDKSIARVDEVPPTWGILAPAGDRLRAVREAPSIEAKPPTRNFLAALARRMVEQSAERAMLNRSYQKGRAEGFEEARRTNDAIEGALRRIKYLRQELRREADALGVILETAGIAREGP